MAYYPKKRTNYNNYTRRSKRVIDDRPMAFTQKYRRYQPSTDYLGQPLGDLGLWTSAQKEKYGIVFNHPQEAYESYVESGRPIFDVAPAKKYTAVYRNKRWIE